MQVREAYRDVDHLLCRFHLEKAREGQIDPGYSLGPVMAATRRGVCEFCATSKIERAIARVGSEPKLAALMRRRSAAEGLAESRLRDVLSEGDNQDWRDLAHLVGLDNAERMVQVARDDSRETG